MEKTLIIIKPCTIQRGLIGEIISRFEKKGLIIAGVKMMWLTDKILDDHYAHLKERPFFNRIKEGMKDCPVIVMCLMGLDAVNVVRNIVGATNGRSAQAGTIRGDYSISTQENMVHASDSLENAKIELNRFFEAGELFEYESKFKLLWSLYASDEL